MNQAWQKFEEMQKSWAARENDLSEEVERLRADAVFVNVALEENVRLKDKAETTKKDAEVSKNVASEATKEAKQTKEELRTCRIDRDYHKDVAETRTALVSELQGHLQAKVQKGKQLAAEVDSLKEEK